MKMKPFKTGLCVIGVACAIGLANTQTARANTIIVNTSSNNPSPAQCNLHNAIIAANTDSAVGGCTEGKGADTIIVPAGDHDIYSSVFSSTITIAGEGANATKLGSNSNMLITEEGDVTFASLLIGGFSNAGKTKLSTCKIYNVGSNNFSIILNMATGQLTFDQCDSSLSRIENFGKLNIDGGNWVTTGSYVQLNNTISGTAIIRNTQLKTVLNTTYNPNSTITNAGDLRLELTDCVRTNSSFTEAGGCINNTGKLHMLYSRVHGFSAKSGGGIYNSGEAIIEWSAIYENRAENGGGIENTGRMTLIGSSVYSNSLNGSVSYGAGIRNVGGVLNVIGSNINGNVGGGLYNFGGELLVDTSAIYDNSSQSYGAGIYNNQRGVALPSKLTVMNSRIYNNRASEFGGGISNDTDMILSNSAIYSNTAKRGAGLSHFSGNAELVNVTLSGNVLTEEATGSAMRVSSGGLTMTNVTINGSVLAATWPGAGPNGEVRIANSILSGSAPNCSQSGTVVFNSLGNNIISDNSCKTFLIASNDNHNTDPLLGPLASDGGAPPTHALLTSSPAKNAANIVLAPPADQRGTPRIWGGVADIGAYEAVDLSGIRRVYIALAAR